MKKVILLAAVLAISASAAFAQTEKGAFRIGGTTNLSFTSVKTDGADKSLNTFDLGVDAGYFLVDNLSLEFGLAFNTSEYDGSTSTDLAAGLGLRYYFPPKVFLGAAFDLIRSKDKVNSNSRSRSGSGLNFELGYAAFVSDHFAIEPAIAYRLGLSDKDDGTKANGFGVQVGLSFYF